MINESGTATSLLDVITKFITFCQLSNESTVAWELIHNDVNSFQGTTFRTPGLEDNSFAYLSFMYRKIESNTYANWFNSGPFYYMSEGYNRSRVENDYYYSLWSQWGTDNISTPQYYENIFADTGEFVSFNVHKQYSNDLYMCEQGGGYKPASNSFNLMPCNMTTYIDGHYSGYTHVNLPIYPGAGYPMLCVADGEITTSSVFRYWFVRTNHNAIITLYLDGIWQCISFGLFNSIDLKSYKFPAYICGGSTGMKPSIWRYAIPNTSPVDYSYATGNLITLSARYHGLSTCTPINASHINSSPSNFLVMRNDGIWVELYNNVQTTSVEPYYSQNNDITNWGVVLHMPTKSSGHNAIFPGDDYADNTCSLHRISSYYNNVDTTDEPELFPIMPYLNMTNYQGMLGYIDNMYAVFSDKLESGVVTIGGHTYLIVPCGWDNRKIYYQYHMGIYYEWNIDSLAATEDAINSVKLYKIAIKLE